MTNRQLIDTLITEAVEFYKDKDWFVRNHHMLYPNNVGQIDSLVVATVLTGFLNQVANNRCMDLGMYLIDFVRQAQKEEVSSRG